MEESFEELYEQFLNCRKEKIKELIEVQSQLNIAEEVSHVKGAQIALKTRLEEADSAIAAAKLSSEIRANASFMMDVMGVGKEQLTAINQNQNQAVIPSSQSIDVAKLGMIENVEFED